MRGLEKIIEGYDIGKLSSVILHIILILSLTGLAIIFLRNFLIRLQKVSFRLSKEEETSKRVKTLTRVLKSVGYVLIISVGGMMVLSELGIDLKPIIAAAGIGGIAIGFGAQSLIKDLIGGFFILLENQVRVGDVVRIGSLSGIVEDIRLRVLILRDLSGNLHIIPHGNITEVTNMTHSFSYYLFNIAVSYKENPDRVMEELRKVGEEMQRDPDYKDVILEPLEILGLDRFEESAIIILARIKTKPLEQWRVGREMNRRIKNTFDRLGIEIPFPHRTVYFGDFEQISKLCKNFKIEQ